MMGVVSFGPKKTGAEETRRNFLSSLNLIIPNAPLALSGHPFAGDFQWVLRE
jgi:hypothetical protein